LTSYLFDASAFITLVKKMDPAVTFQCIREALILDLTFYEAGNAVWKETCLTKLLSPSESVELTSSTQAVLARVKKVESEAEDFDGILELARGEKLSFYDSSYLYYAQEKDLKLVTEDRELYRKAKKHIDVQTVTELLQT